MRRLAAALVAVAACLTTRVAAAGPQIEITVGMEPAADRIFAEHLLPRPILQAAISWRFWKKHTLGVGFRFQESVPSDFSAPVAYRLRALDSGAAILDIEVGALLGRRLACDDAGCLTRQAVLPRVALNYPIESDHVSMLLGAECVVDIHESRVLPAVVVTLIGR